MKKYIIWIVLAAFTCSSCSDFLKELPEDRVTEDQFYQDLEQAQTAVDAIYQPIRLPDVFGGQYLLQVEIMAEFSIGRGSTAAIGAYQGLDATNAQRVGLVWQYLYQSIFYANTAIEKISGMDNVDETAKSQLIAEARFMRAFSYYHLVRHWGAVPLILSTTQGNTPRMPVDEVYAAIIADLENGETVLPEVPKQYGRPTKWASTAFLADVYLTEKEYALAQEKAGAVIASNRFSLVDIRQLDDWNNIFGPSANGTSEEIFYLKYNHQNGWQWPHNLLYNGTPYSPFGNYVITSSLDNKFLNEWNDKDWRKQWGVFTKYIDVATGKEVSLPSLAPVQYSKFRDPDAPTTTGHANDYPFLRYADVLLIHAEAATMAAGTPATEAIEELNMIKRRGYGYPITQASPVDYKAAGWSAQTFQDTILQERAYELFLEGKRWLDLKRTGKIKESIKKYLGITVADAHLNWPIPQQEIDTNPEIGPEDQNPGY